MAGTVKKVRVIYVCPSAHWAGHYPHAVTKESLALLEAGIEVSICTFRGILSQDEPSTIPQETVASSWIGRPLSFFTHLLTLSSKTKGLAWFLEQLATLLLAVKLKKKLRYDVIYLRDGDPFIFLPFILGLVFKHYRWAVSLIGYKIIRSPNSLFYKFISASIWKPIYRRSFSNNQFTFLCQNKYIKDYFEKNFLGGILSGRISVVPLGVEATADPIPQGKAKQYLDLPSNKSILLHFGALHPGKNIEIVLAAIEDIPDALLVHAGEAASSVNLNNLVQRYRLGSKAIIRDRYISEAEKQYYFAAADVLILSYKRDFWQTTGLLWETARFKLPVIASDTGELGELVKKYQLGLVFKAENTTSLREALFNFLSSSQDKMDSIRNNYQKFCHEFSINNWAKSSVEIFLQLCRGR